jgi:hypothetical protein
MKLIWPRPLLVLFALVAMPAAYHFAGVAAAVIAFLVFVLRWSLSCYFYTMVVRKAREAFDRLPEEERAEQMARLESKIVKDIEAIDRTKA